jgi:hypothetical protein
LYKTTWMQPLLLLGLAVISRSTLMATAIKSDLEISAASSKFITLSLLFSIGIKYPAG